MYLLKRERERERCFSLELSAGAGEDEDNRLLAEQVFQQQKYGRQQHTVSKSSNKINASSNYNRK